MLHTSRFAAIAFSILSPVAVVLGTPAIDIYSLTGPATAGPAISDSAKPLTNPFTSRYNVANPNNVAVYIPDYTKATYWMGIYAF